MTSVWPFTLRHLSLDHRSLFLIGSTVHDAIRARHKYTPIFVFAGRLEILFSPRTYSGSTQELPLTGHTHHRNCRMNFDCAGRSIAIEVSWNRSTFFQGSYFVQISRSPDDTWKQSVGSARRSLSLNQNRSSSLEGTLTQAGKHSS